MYYLLLIWKIYLNFKLFELLKKLNTLNKVLNYVWVTCIWFYVCKKYLMWNGNAYTLQTFYVFLIKNS